MELILKSANELFKQSTHNISLLSNASAFLNEVISDINWVGFYLYENDKLILGPFQGKVACEVISINEGVCGYSFRTNSVTNVPNVHEFEGHIACDSRTNSELVIPLYKNGTPIGVLDVDSISFNRFDDKTELLIKEISELIIKYYQL